MEVEFRVVPIDALVLDDRIQGRADGLNEEVVEEYAALYRSGESMIPSVVLEIAPDGKEIYWVWDGFHRTEAIRRTGATELKILVTAGTFRDALLKGAQANATHGLRRSRADKQRAVERLLLDPEWRQWSDREIARKLKVDHKTVGAHRRRLEESGEIPTSRNRKYTTASGEERQIDVSGLQGDEGACSLPREGDVVRFRRAIVPDNAAYAGAVPVGARARLIEVLPHPRIGYAVVSLLRALPHSTGAVRSVRVPIEALEVVERKAAEPRLDETRPFEVGDPVVLVRDVVPINASNAEPFPAGTRGCLMGRVAEHHSEVMIKLDEPSEYKGGKLVAICVPADAFKLAEKAAAPTPDTPVDPIHTLPPDPYQPQPSAQEEPTEVDVDPLPIREPAASEGSPEQVVDYLENGPQTIEARARAVEISAEMWAVQQLAAELSKRHASLVEMSGPDASGLSAQVIDTLAEIADFARHREIEVDGWLVGGSAPSGEVPGKAELYALQRLQLVLADVAESVSVRSDQVKSTSQEVA